MTIIINLPQKLQAVNAWSPSAAGFSLLASLLCCFAPHFASSLAGLFVIKLEIAPSYLILESAAIQLVRVS